MTLGAGLLTRNEKMSFPFFSFLSFPTSPTPTKVIQKVMINVRSSLRVLRWSVEGAHQTHVEDLPPIGTHSPPHTFGMIEVRTVRVRSSTNPRSSYEYLSGPPKRVLHWSLDLGGNRGTNCDVNYILPKVCFSSDKRSTRY